MKKSSTFKFINPGKLIDEELELKLIKKTKAKPAKNYVPSYEFEMRNQKTGDLMGAIRLRIGCNENIHYGGNIGYEVFPNFRGHHYAARSIKLLFNLAKQHRINPLWITCDPANIASRKSCELAGGIITETIDLPKNNEQYRRGDRQVCRYRFDL